ncbi:MAG: dihydrodipicolinate synthase family protein [Gemmataceae bacterium]
MTDASIFHGCIPALMTPCNSKGEPDFAALVRTAQHLLAQGMRAVVYCGSMGEWPLLTDEQRQQGVEQLVAAGVPVIVGTGAVRPAAAADHAAHAQKVGAAGLMVIPRLMSRGSSPAAQHAHFAQVLRAAPQLPAVIYNSPSYGFQTRAELFLALRREHANLVGFKEFGGADALSYAAEHLTSGDPRLALLVGVDTQVFHGLVRCGAVGVITGVGNALPRPVLRLMELCQGAAQGEVAARQSAEELDNALRVLASFDEGPDLVLYYKELMVLQGHADYAHALHREDVLSPSQQAFVRQQWQQFTTWWNAWPARESNRSDR